MNLDMELVRGGVARSRSFHDVHYRARLDSTNRLAVDLVRTGQTDPFIVVTDYQDAGRGRQDRVWLAPPESSLLVSIAMPLTLGLTATDVMFAAAVSVCRSVQRCTDLVLDLKWPNDVLVEGRKIGGLLGETVGSGRHAWAVLGSGINANFDPAEVPGIPESAISLQMVLGHPVDREELLLEYLAALDGVFGALQRDPEAAFKMWVGLLTTVGKLVTVREFTDSWSAEVLGVRRDGSLTVRDDRGRVRHLYAADVSLRTS